MDRNPDGATRRTTDISLSVFDLIMDNNGATMAQLVEETGKAKSSVYNHLQTLRKHGLIAKEGETYHVGVRTLAYAERARTRKPEYDVVRDAVDRLVEQAGDEAGFAVEENDRAVLLYNAANVGDATFQPGEMGPMHATASGKAMLATFDDDRIETIIGSYSHASPTEHTITDKEQLLDEVAAIRERGYSVVDQEFVEGMRSIGVAVSYPNGRLLGALHISAPAYREALGAFRDAVADTIASVAAELEQAIADGIEPQQ